MKITTLPPPGITLADSGATDAFARLRTSEPTTLFDWSAEYDVGSLLWDTATSGTASQTHDPANSAVTLTTGVTAGDSIIRQSRQYHRYQPGKSQLCLFTFSAGTLGSNNRFRVGYFDAGDGIFLQVVGSAVSVVKRKGGSDGAVAQASWNLDTMPDLDITKSQIFFIELEWLGVGRATVGFFRNGQPRRVHQFLHDNIATGVYIRSANLPARYELTNVDGGTAATPQAICCSIISEGGFETGRGIPVATSNGSSVVAVTTRRPILSIRPATTFNSLANRSQVIVQAVQAYATVSTFFELVYNAELSGASWSAVSGISGVQRDVAATGVSAGYVLQAFYVPASGTGAAGAPGTTSLGIAQRLPLTVDISASAATTLSLVATSLGASSNTSGVIAWQEIR